MEVVEVGEKKDHLQGKRRNPWQYKKVYEYGICSECEQIYAIKGNGAIWDHQNPEFVHLCPGAGKPPLRKLTHEERWGLR